MRKKIMLIANCFLLIALITNLSAFKPKCKDCVAISPAIKPDAIALQNINYLIDTATSNAWVARHLANKNNICNNMVGADTNILTNITDMSALKPKCKDCVAIPPAVAPDAIALQNINHLIDTATANAWIARYQMYKDSICNNKVGIDSNVLCSSENFNKQALLKLLCKPNCIGINIAYGMDSAYNMRQIISGRDVNYNRIYIHDSTGVFELEYGQLCKPPCP